MGVSVEITQGLIFSLLAVLMGVGNFIFTWIRSGKGDVKDLEHRLTSLELKVEPLWKAVMEEIPGLLIKKDTPEFDALLQRAQKDLAGLTDTERKALIQLLGVEYSAAVESKNHGRAVAISLYRACFRVESKLSVAPLVV